jgi:dipeptidyl-peptidase-4
MISYSVRRSGRALLAAVMLSCTAARPATAQEPPRDMLARVVSGEFSPESLPEPHWMDDGTSYRVIEAGENGSQEVVTYDTATGRREVVISPRQLTPPGAAAPLPIADLSWSADHQRVLIFTNTRRVWRTDSRGDYWILDRAAGKLRKLGGSSPEASLMYASFDPAGTRVAYVLRNDLYVEDVARGTIRRLTKDGSALVINGASDWVNEEELDLHGCFRWSPDGRFLAFWQFDLHGVGTFPLQYNLGQERTVVSQIPYPTTGPYPVTMSVPYPLAGTTNSAVRVGIVSAEGGAVRWARLPGDPREHYVARLQWVDPATILVQQLNRLQNTDALMLCDRRSGETREMWRDQDQAFITIGFGGLPEARPIAKGAAFLVTTEKDDWMHVYRVDRQGHERLVTRGNLDALQIAGVDEQGGWLYFIGSSDNATERYLYRAPLDGTSDPVRVTPRQFAGTNAYDISPDGRHAFHAFSTFDDPGFQELISLPEHSTIKSIASADAIRKELAPYLAPPVEYFKADAGDGLLVDGYLIKPSAFDRTKKYPVLVFVYGEPAAQTVSDSWQGGQTLYHRYLASLGYIVASFDNAGTPAPRGRQWRKAIYGSVGVLSSTQQAEALRSLAQTHEFVDLDRVAVWGWSGGGTNTLNLMFRFPELYKVGMAVAPMPDQRLYDTIYQERYMGIPARNADGYKSASAINFADRLAGSLLIVHGSGDDNVHYQASELLVNRLIELGKPFEFMTYPSRTHSISEGPGTQLHLFRLLTRYLQEHLAAGPR